MDVEALAEERPVLFHRHGGWLSWRAPEANALHPVDPLLFELGWRAWFALVEEANAGPNLMTLPPDYEGRSFEPN